MHARLPSAPRSCRRPNSKIVAVFLAGGRQDLPGGPRHEVPEAAKGLATGASDAESSAAGRVVARTRPRITTFCSVEEYPLLGCGPGPHGDRRVQSPRTSSMPFTSTWSRFWRDMLYEVERNRDVRCVLFKGKRKHFMAGGDMSSVLSYEEMTPAQRMHNGEGPPVAFAHIAQIMTACRNRSVASAGRGRGCGDRLSRACDVIIAGEGSF